MHPALDVLGRTGTATAELVQLIEARQLDLELGSNFVALVPPRDGRSQPDRSGNSGNVGSHTVGEAVRRSPRTLRNLSLPWLLCSSGLLTSEAIMNGLIYLIGLIVVVLFILSFLGLR